MLLRTALYFSASTTEKATGFCPLGAAVVCTLRRQSPLCRPTSMADLELIEYTPMREIIGDGSISWRLDSLGRHIERLPQIFWDDGKPWSEANHWAVTKATGPVGGDIKTVTALMKHLAAYASSLERMELDWRHFPMRKQDRAIVLYRAELIRARDQGSLAPSTATARMAAVIQFYRHARVCSFINRNAPMWKDSQVVVRYFDTAGFERDAFAHFL